MDVGVFAKRLKAAREARNVTIAELSEALSINKATLYRYELAEINKVKSVTINAIAEYLNVDPDYLIGASDSMYAVKEAEADITDDEKMLLELFRRVPVESQQMVLDMIRIALRRDQ